MNGSKLTGVLVLVAALVGACGPSAIDWRSHVSLRSTGRGAQVAMAHVGPDEVVKSAISRNLHYVTLALDSVFFRNLPGIFRGATVVFGFEIQGVLEDGSSLKTVFEPIRSVGEDAHLALDNVTVIQPFLYTGRNITITLHFRAVAEERSNHIAGRIQGAADILKKLNPLVGIAVSTAKSLFSSIIDAFHQREMRWKYSFTLYPADSIHNDKPELLFLAGRHILIATPPVSAPEELRRTVNFRVLTTQLQLRGNRLVWKRSQRQYNATPYIILNITRYRRYPRPDTELRKAVRKVNELYQSGAYERALEQLKNVGAAVAGDAVITQLEKNLERALSDYQHSRIRAALARRGGERAELHRLQQRQIEQLSAIRSEFRKILEPAELADFDFRIRRLRRRLHGG